MQRIGGLVLFLPVPVVLFLFTRQPLGTLPSLGLGVLLTLTHRLYARPFALARAPRRCLWCGGPARSDAVPLVLEEPLGRTQWRACRGEHRDRLARTLEWAAGHRRFLAVGILGSLGLFFVMAVLAPLGFPVGLRTDDGVAALRLGVALTVLPFGWMATARGALAPPAPAETLPATSPPAAGGRLPFPVHIQALVGTAWVLWLFRLVGLWWLGAGLLHVAHRLTG